MATGASTADVAIVLIDAKAFAKAGGLLPQSRRHTYIASCCGIPHVVAAVNKMDLVDYSQKSLRRDPARVRRALRTARPARRRDDSGQRARGRQRRGRRAPRCPGTPGRRCSNTSKPCRWRSAETTGPHALPGAARAAPGCELPRLRGPGGTRRRCAPAMRVMALPSRPRDDA